ncbi:MAG: bacillithiol system redox-active protein YtxJ [Acidobacteriota bacterium]
MADYRILQSVDDVLPLLMADSGRVLVFKHSLTCPISSRALREYESYLTEHAANSDVEHVLIEIQNTREISNEVANRTSVRHESPQALLIDAGIVVWHASHGAITAQSLGAAID